MCFLTVGAPVSETFQHGEECKGRVRYKSVPPHSYFRSVLAHSLLTKGAYSPYCVSIFDGTSWENLF